MSQKISKRPKNRKQPAQHVLNIRDFREAEDTDDTQAFQRAARHVHTLSGTVEIHVPAGNYHIHGKASDMLGAVREMTGMLYLPPEEEEG